MPRTSRIARALALWVMVSAAGGASGCRQVRGRKVIQDANDLYRRGNISRRFGLRARPGAGAGAASAVAQQGLSLPPAADGPIAGPPPARWRRSPGSNTSRPGIRAATSSTCRRCSMLTTRGAGDVVPGAGARRRAPRRRRSRHRARLAAGLLQARQVGAALPWSRHAAAARPADAEAQYGIGTFIWQVLSSRGGDNELCAYRSAPQADRHSRSRRARQTGARASSAAAVRSRRHRRRAARRDRGRGHSLSGTSDVIAPAPPEAMIYLNLLYRRRIVRVLQRARQMAGGGRQVEGMAGEGVGSTRGDDQAVNLDGV